MAKRKNDRINDILNDIGDMDFLSEEGSQQLAASGLQVEHIHVRLIRPDPAQPRRIFPEDIYRAFHEERHTPAQALRELIQHVQIIARQKGRPFRTILELIPNPDDEREQEPPDYTPEELLLRDLINLAVTLRDDGQVNPLTVVDLSEGVSRLYQIETGERRYWASVLMMDFLPSYQGDGTIPCIIVPREQASVFRQAKENSARSGLNAIAMARQAALLLLASNDIYPEPGPVHNDFYRQALEMRVKYGSLGEVLTAMGGIQRFYFNRIKGLMALSDEALEMADRYNVDEGRLRHVVKLNEDQHAEMVRQIVEFGLTMRQVKEICEVGEVEEDKYMEQTPQAAKKIGDSLEQTQDASSSDLLNYMMNKHKSEHHVRALILQQMDFLQNTLEMLDDVRQM